MSESTDRLKVAAGNAATWTLAVKAVRDVGFPIVVTLILLFQFGPKLDEVNKGIAKLITIMEARR